MEPDTNYHGAAVRHWQDATILRDAGRPDNAGHLIGFAAECAIKHGIMSLRPPKDAPNVHIPDLLIAARKLFGARSGYMPLYQVVKADIFRGWHVSRRYGETGHTSIAELGDWFSETKRLFAAARVKVRT